MLHKTYISVDARGTKAAAVTAVEEPTSALLLKEPRMVYLDRPFAYLLIDCQANLPIFMGVMLDVEA